MCRLRRASARNGTTWLPSENVDEAFARMLTTRELGLRRLARRCRGIYRSDQGAGFIGAAVGALVILFIWNRFVASRIIPDRGTWPRRWLSHDVEECRPLRRPARHLALLETAKLGMLTP